MPTMAADEYMRTRRTRVGIWLVAMASLETANGRENTVLLVLVEDSLAKTREKLHAPR
jgi:1,2-phenylacetyl-CoA epoxidase PaaB subunit